jgi:uncharacterized protein (TIGR03437 family)
MRQFLAALAIVVFGSICMFCAREGAAASAQQTITVRSFLNPDGQIARESLAVAEGTNFTDTEAFDLFNTPTTLGGVQLLLDGVPQRLRSVTATRAVFIVDAVGQATRQVELRTKSGASLQTQITIVNAWPGIFYTGGDPQSNLPSGLWTQDINQPTLQPITSDPLPVGSAQRPTQVVINGSGWRFAALIKVRINSIPCPIIAFGPSSLFPGQDELAFQIPPSLAGAGSVDLIVSVAGREANYARLVLGAAAN